MTGSVSSTVIQLITTLVTKKRTEKMMTISRVKMIELRNMLVMFLIMIFNGINPAILI